MQTILLFLIGLIAVCSAKLQFASDDPDALARIYSNYTQLYRPAKLKVPSSENLEYYRFYFTENEFKNIDLKSLLLLNTNVIERIVTYHPYPSVERVGTRYLYQPSPQFDSTIEIELVDSESKLFRKVEQPNQYFYLKSFDNLIYLNDTPIQPCYEISYLTNRTETTKVPLLSYIDRSISYTPRYFLNLPSLNNDEQAEFFAYADIVNNEAYPIVFKSVELIVKESTTDQDSFDYLRDNLSKYIENSTEDDIDTVDSTYVYRLTLPVPIAIPPKSITSVQFTEANISAIPYLTSITIFSPMNITGNLVKTYNLTSMNSYIPSGEMFYHEQARFVDQLTLPELAQNETYILSTDADLDVNYDRQVRLVPSNRTNDESLTYDVDFTFKNTKQFDVPVAFSESFYVFKNYQIENISPKLTIVNYSIEGKFVVPKRDEITVSYRVTIQND